MLEKVEITEAEYKALSVFVYDPEEWINNAVHSRCQFAIDEIVREEVQRLLNKGETISGSKEDIVLNADIPSMKEQTTLNKDIEETIVN